MAQTPVNEIATHRPRDMIEWTKLLRDNAARQSHVALLQAATVGATNAAQSVIVVAQDGMIIDVRTMQSSGNPLMDHALRNGIVDMPWMPSVTDDTPRGGVRFVLPVNVGTP